MAKIMSILKVKITDGLGMETTEYLIYARWMSFFTPFPRMHHPHGTGQDLKKVKTFLTDKMGVRAVKLSHLNPVILEPSQLSQRIILEPGFYNPVASDRPDFWFVSPMYELF